MHRNKHAHDKYDVKILIWSSTNKYKQRQQLLQSNPYFSTVRWKTRPPNNKYVVNQKLEHVDDISPDDFLVKSEWLLTK
jgi:hypothetical protein